MAGASGSTTLSGTSGSDTLIGGSGSDTLSGGAGSDYLNGGSGSDILDGGSGYDTLLGGSGSDILIYRAWENPYNQTSYATYDVYNGGTGAVANGSGTPDIDQLHIYLSADQLADAAFMAAFNADLAAYESFIASQTSANTLQASQAQFTFTSVSLKVSAIESVAVIRAGQTAVMTESNVPESTSGSVVADGSASFVAGTCTTSFGTFHVNADGTWTFNAASAFDQLNVGDNITQTFNVLSTDGSVVSVTVVLNGTNDAAVISGDTSGDATEAGGVANGTAGSNATGDLNSTDVDNPNDSWTVVASATAGDNGYGSYTIDASGHWTYVVDDTNATVQALNVGDSLTDTFTVTTIDGTSQLVTVTIHGANDAAVISGDTSGSVIEATSSNPGTPTAIGTLMAADVDNPDNVFTASSGNSTHGSYSIDAAGHWTYTLNNADPAVDALNDTQTLTDTFTVTSVDGTQQTVTLTINGTTDNVAPIANSDVLWVSNNTTVTLSANALLGNDVDPDGLAETITGIAVASGSLSGPVTVNADGSFTFTTGATGGTTAAPTVVTLTYTVSDGAGGTSTGTATVNVISTGDVGSGDNINLAGVGAYQASYIDGKGGGDTLNDGSAVSTLLGGAGGDTINGNNGSDLIVGGDGNDILNGGDGNDIIRGGNNNDTMDGGTGSEDLLDFSDATQAIGTAANPFVLVQGSGVTNVGNSVTGLGNDSYTNMEGVIGGSSNDFLTGSTGNDILRGGPGNDTLDGAAGIDLIDFRDGTAGITFTLTQSSSNTVFNASAAGLGTDTYKNFEGVIGTNFNDTLNGSASNDVLRGEGGNDVINGNGGNDTITGGAGADTLSGGAGNDTFVMTPPLNAVDTITDYSNVVGNADIIDLTQILNVPLGGNAIGDGYLRVTTTGLLQVDLNGGGDGWITVANVNTAGVSSYTIQYLLNGVATTANVTPVAPPIGIDLNGDGHVSFLGTDAGVTFDYGYGKVGTAWVGPQDGILVNDANHDGQVTASEIVFSTGGSDLQGLAQYDSNHDGQLTAADAAFSQFAVWQDANSNGVVDAGEMKSLAALGISGISLSSDGISYSAAGGDVQVVGTGSVTYADGRTGVLADAVFATASQSANDQVRVASALSSNAALLGAVAAAGLAAMPAHAEFREMADPHAQAQFGDTGVTGTQPALIEAAAADHALSNESAVPLGVPAVAAVVQSSAPLMPSADVHAANSGSAPEQHMAELLQGTTAPHANPIAAPLSTAGAVSPITAEMLQAAMAGVQHAAEKPGAMLDPSAHGSAELGQVLADALAAGNGKPDIESLLHAATGPAHDQVLSHTALGGSAPHEMFGGVIIEDRTLMQMHDTMMLHQLAAPSH